MVKPPGITIYGSVVPIRKLKCFKVSIVSRACVSVLFNSALRDALGSSLARMHSLERPGEPAPQQTVPIQSLLYRGKSAVTRSKALRAQILAATTPPSRDTIAELCDLVELAAAE